jgi:hypothetical protein
MVAKARHKEKVLDDRLYPYIPLSRDQGWLRSVPVCVVPGPTWELNPFSVVHTVTRRDTLTILKWLRSRPSERHYIQESLNYSFLITCLALSPLAP